MSAEFAQDRNASVGADTGITTAIRRHPVAAFFTISFVGTWLAAVPILLSQRGLGLFDVPDAIGLVNFLLTTYAGPFLAAWVVTRVMEGREGVRQWFRRMLQWRVGWLWYLLVLVGYPVAFGVPALVLEGQPALSALQQNVGSFLPAYLATILIGFFVPTLGEEAGWRGFALTRLQRTHGALLSTLLVGVMHALWHIPMYFVKGAISESGVFDPIVFGANSLAIIAASFIWTWLFNHAAGSILFATFVHAASNAMSANLPRALDLQAPNPWFAFGVLGALAVLVIALTRGRLGYSEADRE